MSKTLNLSTSDLHEAQGALHVQLQPSKERKQRHQEKAGGGQVKRQGPSIKYSTCLKCLLV